MMKSSSRWECDRQQIAAKIVDGEAILIHITTGNYHSMDNVGGFLWGHLDEGRTLEECANLICENYDVEFARASDDVNRIVESLQAAGLIQPRTADTNAPCSSSAVQHSPLTPADQRLGYEAPCLHHYDDMKDLLALDPPMPGVGPMSWDDADRTQ